MKRNSMRRSFAVEVKSSGRHGATIIPARTPFVPHPRRPAALHQEAGPPVAEPDAVRPRELRRVLPSLIVPLPEPEPEPEPEPLPAQDDDVPRIRRPRGRPPKAKAPMPVFAEPPEPPPPAVAVPVEPAPAAAALRPRSTPEKTAIDLNRGERWKRRLSRWSR